MILPYLDIDLKYYDLVRSPPADVLGIIQADPSPGS